MRRIPSLARRAACIGVLAWLVLTAGHPATAAVIGFDNLLGGGIEDAAIVSPYAGFTWTNFYALDTVLYTADLGPNGYANGVVSGPNVAYAGYGNPASFSTGQGFMLFSYAIGAAWNNDMAITVQGWRAGVLVGSDSFTVSTTGSFGRQPGWINIDTVTFSAAGGTGAGYPGLGPEFYLDDIQVNQTAAANESPISEPAAIWLLVPAIAVAALSRHRRLWRGRSPRNT